MSSHINKAWGPLLRRRSALPALLTVLAVGFALIAVAPSVTRGREMLLKTACVEAPGYEAFPEYVTTYSSGDVLPSFDNDYSEGSFHHDAASALLACDSDPNCIGYNTLGFTFTKAGFKSVSWTNEGICQYIKIGSSGAFSGYTRRPYLTWIPTETDTIFIDMASPAAAKKACDQNPACTAWNTAGQYAVGAVDTKNFEASPGGTTLYLKQVCPEKFGYTSYHGFTLSGVSGVNGVGTGKMPGGSADAADFCKLNYPCTAFSTDGSYAIGAVNLKNSDNSTCTYVKERKSSFSN
ncbi:hypothetical protein Vafri_21292 [Volvox africanus]|uniref:Uncharacterized protein n=1 Tax=Volvox africanus TaxID=51714 RepID=A0A8J4FDR0_9CHLO|nr:hypothetical protein Vafri_21292 [Volvox africanus]